MKKLIKLIVLILVFCCITAAVACSAGETDMFMLGTTVTVNLKGGSANKAFKEIVQEIERLEQLLSTSVPDSDIDRINKANGGDETAVSKECVDLLIFAGELYENTDKAFNIALFPLVELWQFSPDKIYEENKKPPSNQDIFELMPYVDFNDLSVDADKGIAVKKDGKMKIDLGGIAKGYIADRANQIAEKHGVKSGIINVGGNIYVIGEAVKVGITDPRRPSGTVAFSVRAGNISIVTSGDYEKCYFYDNERYHHIIDGVTGSPAKSGVISATVIGGNSALADSLATAAVVMGLEKSLALIQSYSLSALIITEKDGKLHYNSTGDYEFTPEIDGYERD